MNKTVKLDLGDNKVIELPVLKASVGMDVIDSRELGKNGYWSFDPAFLSTAACESQITYIDGDKGELFYRGYPIEQLAEASTHLECAYLLLYGELPNKEQKADFENQITRHTLLDDQLHSVFKGFRRDAQPMAMLTGIVGALAAFYPNAMKIYDKQARNLAIIQLIAKMPTISAMCCRYINGQPFMYPKNSLDYTSNFLHMMFANPAEDYTVNPTIAKALDLIFLLHADHEQNASTSTVRIAGSSGTHPFSAMAAGVACLWGPSHGGANEAVIKMLQQVGEEKNADNFIQGVKNKEYKLMGFGHRVYKNMDPRAAIIRKSCYEVLEALGKKDDPLFKLALYMEKVALSDKYFIEKKLYPNVDFYSGIMLHAMGIPTKMFTVIFSLARVVGWLAQWKEMVEEGETLKISRPRQLYTGPTKRDYLPLEQR